MTKPTHRSRATKDDGRIRLVQSVQTPLGFFVLSVLVVEVILSLIVGATNGWDRSLAVGGMLVILVGLIATVAFLSYNRPEALRGDRPSDSSRPGTLAEVRIFTTRDDYLNSQLEAIRLSRTDLALFTSKLHRSEETEDARRVNEALAGAVGRGTLPRVLVALTDTRLAGALELSRRGIARVRFDPTLHLSDVNYLCVDERLAILGERGSFVDGIDYRPSQGWYRVQSRTLAASLTRHFDARWSDYGTLTVEQMLRVAVPRNVRAHGLAGVSEALGLPAESTAMYSKNSPLVILLAGRPASGKTTIAKILISELGNTGLRTTHISDLYFIQELFRATPGHGSGFSATPDGGYVITVRGESFAAHHAIAKTE